jgi:hypothetical protein
MEIPRRIRTHSILSVGSEYKVNSRKVCTNLQLLILLSQRELFLQGSRHIKINILHGYC